MKNILNLALLLYFKVLNYSFATVISIDEKINMFIYFMKIPRLIACVLGAYKKAGCKLFFKFTIFVLM